MIRLLFTEKLL